MKEHYISVIISTYKCEKPAYLDRALKSIWDDQKRKPDEIVLVEDGPLTKELYDVIETWEKKLGSKLAVIEKPVNGGLAAALNDAIGAAHGDLVARMDSDDISLPDRFLLQEQYMDEHPEVDILGGSIREFNDEGTLSAIQRYPATMQEVLCTMYKASPLAHPTVMYRSSFFKAGYRYSSKYHICEDVTMWYDAAAGGRVINSLQDVLLEFRRNPSVLQRRSREKAWSEFLAYNDGISRLYGRFSYKYIYSFMRMCFRLMPASLVSFIYDSKLRRIFARHG
ncbi:MAG: glycosyltransferase [Prevotella sp.]|nr:glycosyltransferase [Prevotella sp.]